MSNLLLLERRRLTYRGLVTSLAHYVRPGDTKLSYDLFLRQVIDRIVNDLSEKLDTEHARRLSNLEILSRPLEKKS